VRSWFYGIATNLLRTRLRSEERSRRAFMRAGNLGEVGAGPYDTVDDAAELAWLSRTVLEALAQLSREQRELLVLYAWEGLEYRQIASVLDVAVGTVRSRLSRSRRRLRELLEGSGEVFSETDDKPRSHERT
jgi:RNA polymerase sigma-70 factor (ECF subfamily)